MVIKERVQHYMNITSQKAQKYNYKIWTIKKMLTS